MAKHSKLWIVIADGEHARVVSPREDFVLETKERFDSETARLRAADLVSDKPGRVQESSSPSRHGVEPRTDPREAAKERFVKDLGHRLLQASRNSAFDELVLVAPNHILGELRDALDKPATDKLRGALGKDLINVPDHELQPHLSEWVRPPHRVR